MVYDHDHEDRLRDAGLPFSFLVGVNDSAGNGGGDGHGQTA